MVVFLQFRHFFLVCGLKKNQSFVKATRFPDRQFLAGMMFGCLYSAHLSLSRTNREMFPAANSACSAASRV
jgi:hypothetical protein